MKTNRRAGKVEDGRSSKGKRIKKKKKKKKKPKSKGEKTVAEMQEMKKQEEFEEARKRCVEDLQAMQGALQRLSELNSENLLSIDEECPDGLVEKLRGEVASAHLVANVSVDNELE